MKKKSGSLGTLLYEILVLFLGATVYAVGYRFFIEPCQLVLGGATGVATLLRTVSFHFPIAVVGICCSACFQALGNGIYSTIVSLCRQMIALLPAAFLLSLSGNVNAVWWAFPIAEVVSSVTAAILFVRIYKKKIKPMI